MRRSSEASMSRATAGSSPSLIRTPAVVCGTYRWQTPDLQPDSWMAWAISSVTFFSSVRRVVRMRSVRVMPPGFTLLRFRPGRRDAGHASVGDELAHVFVGMDDDAEIHAVNGGVAAENFHGTSELGGSDSKVRGFDGFERALEPGDDVGFFRDAFFHFLRQVGRHFRSRIAGQVKIRDGDVHIDFARRADVLRRAPGEFFFGRSFGEGDELARDVSPFAVVALPDAFGNGLRVSGPRREHCAKEKQHEQHSLHFDLRRPAASYCCRA